MDESGKKILKALSYFIWPIGLVTFLIAEGDSDMKYHGAQGFTFGITLTIISWILAFVFAFIPFLWWLSNIVWLLVTIAAILYAVKAYKGERFRIPVVYDLMRKFYKEGEEPQTPIMGQH